MDLNTVKFGGKLFAEQIKLMLFVTIYFQLAPVLFNENPKKNDPKDEKLM